MEKVGTTKEQLAQNSSIRLRPREMALIAEAARILDVTRSEFLRLASLERASRLILDREQERKVNKG